jgi:hypothetical protein
MNNYCNDGRGHIDCATAAVISLQCSSCARGQSSCANNQPVTHAADTQEHLDLITMAAIVLLKTKKIPHFVTHNTRAGAPAHAIVQGRSGVDTLIHGYTILYARWGDCFWIACRPLHF